jgi:hypothetical protein
MRHKPHDDVWTSSESVLKLSISRGQALGIFSRCANHLNPDESMNVEFEAHIGPLRLSNMGLVGDHGIH